MDMSLILNNTRSTEAVRDIGNLEARRDMAALERYLAVLEENRKACCFVPDDAAAAIDMARFVCGRRHGGEIAPMSAARMAMALIQRIPDAPIQ